MMLRLPSLSPRARITTYRSVALTETECLHCWLRGEVDCCIDLWPEPNKPLKTSRFSLRKSRCETLRVLGDPQAAARCNAR